MLGDALLLSRCLFMDLVRTKLHLHCVLGLCNKQRFGMRIWEFLLVVCSECLLTFLVVANPISTNQPLLLLDYISLVNKANE
jgi:hypothetical protein